MAWVDRDAYMERIWPLEGTRDIKVITGMRSSGKSELMKAFSASVARKDPSSNNVYIDLLDLDNEPLLEYHALHREIIERYKEGSPGPTITMTSRSRTTTSVMSTRPSSRTTLFKSFRCQIPPC